MAYLHFLQNRHALKYMEYLLFLLNLLAFNCTFTFSAESACFQLYTAFTFSAESDCLQLYVMFTFSAESIVYFFLLNLLALNYMAYSDFLSDLITFSYMIYLHLFYIFCFPFIV